MAAGEQVQLGKGWWAIVVLGVLGILAGIVIVRRPGETLLVLVIAAGLWLVLSSAVQIIGALLVLRGWQLRHAGRAPAPRPPAPSSPLAA
jgi:uncharacterized membrane protein HdeD (DUF308 family)